jgi:CDP-diacylglycerol---glycerol-3-phosphate 3-phosphatidyltransferase
MKLKKHHGWDLSHPETLLTPASYITMIRTLVAVALAVYALVSHEQLFLLYALGFYWIGDIADGLVARYFHHETRSGALFDIVADRLCVSLIYMIYASFHPEVAWAIGLYLVEFIFIDGFLSLSFLFWPLLSPNYFYLVDKRIFDLNWSLIGKAVNSSLFLFVTVLFHSLALSLVVVSVVIMIKIYSLRRLYAIGIPTPKT